MADSSQLPQSSISQSNTPGTTSQPGTSQQDPGLQLNSTGQRQQGTGFTNINKILNAGSGAGQQLGNAIGAGVSNQAQGFSNNLSQAQNNFNTQAGQNTYGANDQSNVTNTINSIIGPGSTQQSALTAGQNANAQQFQNYINGQYNGPTQLGSTQQLQNQAMNVQQLGQATQSQGGQQGLLQQFAGKGQYTAGEQGLDSALLGIQGQQGLQQARSATTGIQQQLGNATTQAQQAAQTAQGTNAVFGQNVLGQLTTATQPIDQAAQVAANNQVQANQTLNTQAGTLASSIQDIINKKGITTASGDNSQAQAVSNLINQGQLTQPMLTALGIDPSTYVGDISLNNLQTALASASQTPTTVSPGQMINSTQAAQLQALQGLAGGKSILPQDISQAQIQAALSPAGNTYTNPTLSGIGGTAGIIGNDITTASRSNILNNDQTQLANYISQQSQLQNLLNSANKPITTNTGLGNHPLQTTGNYVAGISPSTQSLQQQIANYGTDIYNTQQAISSPQYQTIQQLLNSAQPSFGDGTLPRGGNNTSTGASNVGAGTGNRIE